MCRGGPLLLSDRTDICQSGPGGYPSAVDTLGGVSTSSTRFALLRKYTVNPIEVFTWFRISAVRVKYL